MTVIIGILCEDGVVIGSDTVSTLAAAPGHTTIEQQNAIKIEVIGGKAIIATTGAVGLAQRFKRVMKTVVSNNILDGADIYDIGIKISGTTIENFRLTASAQQQHPNYGWGLGALVAFKGPGGEPKLFEFDPFQFHPELKADTDPNRGDRTIRFATMGSGQTIADPLLGFIYKIFWPNGEIPKLADAKLAVAWTLQTTIDLNTGGVGGEPKLAVLEKDNNKWVAQHIQAGEVMQKVKELEDHIAAFKNGAGAGVDAAPPPIPKLPEKGPKGS